MRVLQVFKEQVEAAQEFQPTLVNSHRSILVTKQETEAKRSTVIKMLETLWVMLVLMQMLVN